MRQENAITEFEAPDTGERPFPLIACWAIWAGASAALWTIILGLL